MALTLGQMETRVRRVLRDKGGKFVTKAEVIELLNEAQLEIATRTLCIQVEATGTFTTYQLALPSTYIGGASLRVGTEIDDVEWVDNETFDSWRRGGEDPPHTIGRIFAGNFEVYPTPDVGEAYTLRYAKTPTILDDDADTAQVMPVYEQNMIAYARAHAKLKDGETGEYEAYMSMFDKGLPETMGPTTNFKPGPMNLRYEPGPFDTADAGHL